jgi:oligopeptide/dipeptide ABC transporter ATP-binding protein
MLEARMTIASEPQRDVLLTVENVKKYFPISVGGVRRQTLELKAVDDVSFGILRGETHGLVGESGCGKTTTARIILRTQKPTAGRVLLGGRDINRRENTPRAGLSGLMSAVFQDPGNSLDPRMTVGNIIEEPLRPLRLARAEAEARIASALEDVRLKPSAAKKYPHEFSGGQRQRIAIARAVVARPKLIVLDEPVSNLDVSIRAQVMNLLKSMQQRYGISYLLISHNLATVRFLSHRVSVMYLGKIIETAESEELFSNPLHPYTRALITASLSRRGDSEDRQIVLRGEPPSPLASPTGCTFHPRCPFAFGPCAADIPPLREVRPGHLVSCHLHDPIWAAEAARGV